MSSKLQTFIDEFLDRYNPSRSLEVAIKNALKAALEHNKLYSPNLHTNKRNEIKAFWSDQPKAKPKAKIKAKKLSAPKAPVSQN